MQFLVFILTYPFIWLFSRLPMRILYLFSDFFFVLLYYVIGYRKEVVLENLKLAFPNKSKDEIFDIRKKFYKHFTDIFIESVKAFTISEKEILKRYRYKNPEIVNQISDKGKSIALVGAHLGNWEWSINLPLVLKTKPFGAYTKLSNRYYEKILKNSRTKFGFIGFPTNGFVKNVQQNFKNNQQGVYLLLSDQSPQVHKTFYWAPFFGVTVPVHTGAEMLAKKYDMAVVNFVAKKIKRGYYEVEFELITETPKAFKNYEITDQYLAITERNIKAQPDLYLWSHRRFKHRDKAPKNA